MTYFIIGAIFYPFFVYFIIKETRTYYDIMNNDPPSFLHCGCGVIAGFFASLLWPLVFFTFLVKIVMERIIG